MKSLEWHIVNIRNIVTKLQKNKQFVNELPLVGMPDQLWSCGSFFISNLPPNTGRRKQEGERLCLGRKDRSPVSLTALLFITSVLDNLSWFLADKYPTPFPCLRNPLLSVAGEEAGSPGRGWQSHVLLLKIPMTEIHLWFHLLPWNIGYSMIDQGLENLAGGGGCTCYWQDTCIHMEVWSSMLNLENEACWLWVWFAREWVIGFGHKLR